MKTIGLIGGMSWESSIEYYRIINEAVKERLGGLHSAQSLMYSVDFADVELLQDEGRWQEAAEIMIDAGQRLERGARRRSVRRLGAREMGGGHDHGHDDDSAES